MPYVTTEIEVDLDDFDDYSLIKEMKHRGYDVVKSSTKNVIIEDVIWRYTRGYIEDAMILLERMYPELYGLHKRIK